MDNFSDKLSSSDKKITSEFWLSHFSYTVVSLCVSF